MGQTAFLSMACSWFASAAEPAFALRVDDPDSSASVCLVCIPIMASSPTGRSASIAHNRRNPHQMPRIGDPWGRNDNSPAFQRCGKQPPPTPVPAGTAERAECRRVILDLRRRLPSVRPLLVRFAAGGRPAELVDRPPACSALPACLSALLTSGQAEAQVVAAVAGGVRIAIGRADELGSAATASAADHAADALGRTCRVVHGALGVIAVPI